MDEASERWGPDVPWRQGHVLHATTCEALGLNYPDGDAVTCVVVIGHDCDLATSNLDAEPNVEVIVGRIADNPNGNFSWAKSPRTLQVPMNRGGQEVLVELTATKKMLVPKRRLAAHKPDTSMSLDGKGLSVLRSWLSARYQRSAFPNAFVYRMKETKFDMKLARILEPHGRLISFVYFDLGDDVQLERVKGDPYRLGVVLVYPPGDDPLLAEESAEAVAGEVEAACLSLLKNGDAIVLKRCLAVSEDDVTVSQAKLLMHWRLEYMSLRGDGDPPRA